MVFIDGSNTGVGTDFCATEESGVTHRWARRLDDNNSIFQTELFAICKTLEWISQQNLIFF